MEKFPSAAAARSAPARQGFLARIAALLDALDSDHFAAPEVRIERLEQRIARLEAAAAKPES
ncbi:hypothetical protein NSE01_16490 [Novosphingobium sediminis]|uniref:Uncharacterized protein n=1 Tax=Novosphingobium sediminis TaxID=707214 RepID=A0A512AJH2_9SPHN|nr:hypothetical protein [Novosphingobium sediminis]GEN99816.1 hypothetical protein NSE01_16490 [Novosphingobium sediminis]